MTFFKHLFGSAIYQPNMAIIIGLQARNMETDATKIFGISPRKNMIVGTHQNWDEISIKS